MRADEQQLELLISRHLDGQITADEQATLDEALAQDPEARTLFTQMKALHETCVRAVQEAVVRPGPPAAEVLEVAWAEAGWSGPIHKVRRIIWSQVGTGLAAGLLLGVILHAYALRVQGPGAPTGSNPGVNLAGIMDQDQEVGRPHVLEEVDWYTYTDGQGNRWLVQGVRQDRVRPAVYCSDL